MLDKFNKKVILKIYGTVQGVNYRYYSYQNAKKLKITGWVKNESDGSVTITAEGREDNLKKFIDWCYKGPKLAKVSNIEIKWEEYTGQFKNFEIK